MVVNYQNFGDPFVVILALPATFCGIATMLYITDTTLSVPSLMGAIMAVGVASANSILLVTFAREQQLAGMSAFDAAISNLAQARASRRQAKANRELARVTWGRDSVLMKQGWTTQQQGDADRLNYQAQQRAARASDDTIKSQEAQLLVLRQQKAYQQIVAPLDGVVTRRNIDVGTLVQADTTSGTFMFTLSQSSVLRIQLAPQDAAIGVKPGIDAVVRVPEVRGRSFPGKVTRIAVALDPSTRTLPTEVRDLGTEVEVSDGVKAGDQVVLTPPVDLGEGGKVQVRAPATAKAAAS
jgi:multidrug efflux pump subunit AcrA (membrane-fusion protein)